MRVSSLFFLFSLLTLFGCNKASKEQASSGSLNYAIKYADLKKGESKLLSAGKASASKRLLKYKMGSEGQVFRASTVIEFQQKVTAKGKTRDIKWPKMVTKVSMTQQKKLPGGDFSFIQKIESSGMEGGGGNNPKVQAFFKNMEKGMKMVEGLSASLHISESGYISHVKYKLDDFKGPPAIKSMLKKLEEQLSKLSIVLPKVPVAVGAKWIVGDNIEMMNFMFYVVNAYEVLSMDGDIVKLKSKIHIGKAIGQAQGSGLAGVEMPEVDGQYNGTVTIDLKRPVSNSTLHGKMYFEVKVPGQSEPLKIKMKNTTQVTAQ